MQWMDHLKEEILKLTSNEEVTEQIILLFKEEIKRERELEKDIRRQSRRNAIQKAVEKGASFGRPKKKPPENFHLICKSYRKGDLKAEEAAMLSGMSISTFYRKMKELK